MTITFPIAIVLTLSALTVFLSKQWRHSSLGLMSQEWISEQRSDESRHRLT
jgi:hypothetical protein